MAQTTMYAGFVNSPEAKLTAGINSSATTIPVDHLEYFPAAPNVATIGKGPNAETIYYGAKSAASGAGNLTTVTRGWNKTGSVGAAIAWPINTVIARRPTEYDHATFKANIEDLAALNLALYKGVIDCSGNPNYPAANAAEMYFVSVAGKIGGASGVVVTAGDTIICNTDGTASGDQATVGANWNVLQTNIDLTNITITGSAISGCNVTVGSGKTLDVSAGTLTLADNQISGDKVEGGTISAITITTLTTTTQAADTNDTKAATTAFVVGQAGAATPLDTGTAAAGTSLKYSRQDHVHPREIPWTEVTGTSQAAAQNNAYITNNAALVTVTLPATAIVGSRVRVAGKGAGGWRIYGNTGQQIIDGANSTESGNTDDYVQSGSQYDTVELLSITANTTFSVISKTGTLTTSYGRNRGVIGGGTTGSYSNVIDYIKIGSISNATDFGDLTVARKGDSACSSSTKGVFGGGNSGSVSNVIDYITIITTGNATDFGDLTVARGGGAGCSSSTKGVFGGGNSGSVSNVIDYITIITTGNATDFGDLTVAREGGAGCSSSTIGVFGGGTTGSYSNVIDYITIATPGNATDFGDLTVARYGAFGSCSSSTIGVFGGGTTGSYSNVIDYITIATPGNATDFGDLTVARYGNRAFSSSTRGVFGGGYDAGGCTNVIDYITIATPGNATDFGDLTVARQSLAACSSLVRGTFDGGYTGSLSDVIDYITIASTGNAADFGDLSIARYYMSSCSNGHGGLS